MKAIAFKYTRFKPSGKMYESDCKEIVHVADEHIDNMYYIHEAIRKLHSKIDPDMIWAIGMEDNWFANEEAQQVNFPVLIGMN